MARVMDVLTIDLQAPLPARATPGSRRTARRGAVVQLPRTATSPGGEERARFAALCCSVAAGDSHAPARGRDWLRPGW
jgi:hypothetical protein